MLLHLAQQCADTASSFLHGCPRTAGILLRGRAGTQAVPAGRASRLNRARAQQVAQRYADTVGPFLRGCPRTADALPPGDAGTQALYLWATAVVASYSFTIGSDRQACVPSHSLSTEHHSLKQEALHVTPMQWHDAV